MNLNKVQGRNVLDFGGREGDRNRDRENNFRYLPCWVVIYIAKDAVIGKCLKCYKALCRELYGWV